MRYATFLGLGLLVAALAVVGCARQANTPKGGDGKKTVSADDGDHAHGTGPNGGVVFDLSKYHAEFTVDHDKKEATVLILGDDEKTPAPVIAKDLTLTTKEAKTKDGKAVPPMTIKMLPQDEADGKASKYVGTDPGLGMVADFEGTVSGEINGKPAAGDFKE